MKRPWRESTGLVPWLILIAVVLALAVLFKRGALPRDISDHTIGLIGAVSSIATTVILIAGAILSYFKFFKGRTLSPKLIIIPSSGKVTFNDEVVHWIETKIENKGSVAIWNYQVSIEATLHMNKDEHVKVLNFMPAPADTEGRERVIDVGETVFEHAFLPVPEGVSAITFQIAVTDKSKTIWWRCLTVNN